jgi:two-component system, chemotaxis family, chemotaxis protein CheY
VVIVDDSSACRRVIRELLERRGYQVTGEAGCAAAAVDLVGRLSPDAVLLDVHLPDASGFDLAAQLREQHPGLAILLTSIDFQSNFYALADVSGARGFVPKHQLAQVQFDLFWSNRRDRPSGRS